MLVPVALVKENCVSELEETLLLKVVQSAAVRQPKVPESAGAQVTLPFAYASAPEKVVVAAAYTRPLPFTARPEDVSDGMVRVPAFKTWKVEEALA